MYEIRPEALKTFISDNNIKLPRFQRKQTWDEKKNFQLCISVFKQYPIGVTILSVEEIDGKTVRWLLDGRQRKNALSHMLMDPENIYNWAKKFIGFKNNDQPSELELKFWEKINQYIEYDKNEEEEPLIDSTQDEIDNTTPIQCLTEHPQYTRDKTGLNFLLEIIKIIHNRSQRYSGFTRPFDISKFVTRVPYAEVSDGKFSSRKLKTFLDEYRKYSDDSGISYEKYTSFIEFLENRCSITNKEGLGQYIEQNWNAIIERLSIIERLDGLFTNSKIGLIEVKNLSPADSQKIFNIINSEGETLAAVEVLSAKPSWNKVIESPSADMKQCVSKLYDQIGGIVNTDIVKWDLPATLVKRIGSNIILKTYKNEPNDFAKEITMGFKLLAGIWGVGVKKEDIEKLSKNSTIRWESDIEALIQDIKNFLRIVSGSTYFSFLKSWRTSVMELCSDSIALNYFIILYNDWVRKGKPIGSDGKTKQFQKNCLVLWDKLIYEYVTVQWRGSGDSKIASNISALSTEADIFSPVNTDKWLSLLDEIFKENKIVGNAITVKSMKPILYHFYCLNEMQGPDTQYDIEIDHIIPQNLFESSILPQKELLMHNLLNLGLLPKKENISKSNKKLILIDNPWLKSQIVKYEFVAETDFLKYSDLNNYIEMFESRKKLFVKVFTDNRNNFLNNY